MFGDEAALRRLEAILHPRVKAAEGRFLRQARAQRRSVVAPDIPLLFETGGAERCDAVIVVSAPRFVQAARVLARPGMTPARLAAILARQMPDDRKQWLADFVVPTGLDRRTGLRALGGVVTLIGLIMLATGRRKLDPAAVAPRRTAAALRKDTEMIKGVSQHEHD